MWFSLGFPSGLAVKNLSANAGDVILIPGLGRSPGERNGNPFQYSCLKNSIDRSTWKVHGVTKGQTRLSTYAHTLFIHSLYFKYPSRNTICFFNSKIIFYTGVYWLARLCQFQVYSKEIHVSILFQIIFPFRFLYRFVYILSRIPCAIQ